MIIFFVLAVIAVAAAIVVVNVKSPVSSALFLVMTMCSIAGLFALMGALFLAALQVIVYAGAIMVLFLFVIMLLNMRRDEFGIDPHRIQRYLGFVLVAVILVQGLMISSWAMKDFAVPWKSEFQTLTQAPGPPDYAAQATEYSGAHSVARTLFTRYAYPFEITSVLLLSAIIGAVVIARRKRSDSEGEGS